MGVKTQERLHSWSGVPTDHKGNVLTELPANPEEIKSKRRKKKKVNYKPNLRRTNWGYTRG